MKSRFALLASALCLALALSIALVRAEEGACADVKNGSVKFMDSPSCIKECAEDGGDCPYSAQPRTSTPPAPAAPVQPEGQSKPKEPKASE